MKTRLSYTRNGVRFAHIYPVRWIAEMVAAVMLTNGASALCIGPVIE